MNFFRYWAKANQTVIDDRGISHGRTAFGHSNQSMELAIADAEKRAKVLALAARDGELPRADQYYPVGPQREEIIESFDDDHGPHAILTRNNYGCIVLNTRELFFADIDVPEPTWMQKLMQRFRKRKPAELERLIETLKRLVAEDQRLGFRLYRTRQGYRVMLTSRPLPLGDPLSDQLMDRLNADPLYRRLCRFQECYRARLTPKPWRINALRAPRGSRGFPFESKETEAAYRAWESAYHQAAGKFSVCELIGEFGSDSVDDSLAPVRKLHDHYALSSGLPLA